MRITSALIVVFSLLILAKTQQLNVKIEKKNNRCNVQLLVDQVDGQYKKLFRFIEPITSLPIIFPETYSPEININIPLLCQPCVIDMALNITFEVAIFSDNGLLGSYQNSQIIAQCSDSETISNKCSNELLNCASPTTTTTTTTTSDTSIGTFCEDPSWRIVCSTVPTNLSSLVSSRDCVSECISNLITTIHRNHLLKNCKTFNLLADEQNTCQRIFSSLNALNLIAMTQTRAESIVSINRYLVSNLQKLSLVSKSINIGCWYMVRDITTQLVHSAVVNLIQNDTSTSQPITAPATLQRAAETLNEVLEISTNLWEKNLCFSEKSVSENDFSTILNYITQQEQQKQQEQTQIPAATFIEISQALSENEKILNSAVFESFEKNGLDIIQLVSTQLQNSTNSPKKIIDQLMASTPPASLLMTQVDNIQAALIQVAKTAMNTRYTNGEIHSTFTAPQEWTDKWQEYSPLSSSFLPQYLQIFSKSIVIANMRVDLTQNPKIDIGFDGSVLSTPWTLSDPAPAAHLDLSNVVDQNRVTISLILMNSKIGKCCEQVVCPSFRIRIYDKDGVGLPATTLASSYYSFPPNYCVKRYSNGFWSQSAISVDGLQCSIADNYGKWSKNSSPFGQNMIYCAITSPNAYTFGVTQACPIVPVIVTAPVPTAAPQDNYENVQKAGDNIEAVGLALSGAVIGLVTGACFAGASVIRHVGSEFGGNQTEPKNNNNNNNEKKKKTTDNKKARKTAV